MVVARPWFESADRSRPIGRDADAARVGALLLDPEIGLVTITGPGGVGKTTQARFVAGAVGASFPDGVHGVDLTAISRPDDVAGAIGAAVGLHEIEDEDPASSLVGHLLHRRALLLLDNVEHVLEAATLVAHLIAACPDLTVLATSREALRLRGERRYPLAPLALPSDAQRASVEALASVAGVDLFVRRARAVAPDFVLDDANAAAVAEIVIRVDGLPLAIELAAAHVRHLSPEAVLARLQAAPLDLLSGGPRDQPARQRAVEATIAWSYDLLTPDERRLLQLLGVFASGFAPDAVAAVAAAVWPDAASGGDLDIPACLEALVDKSLIVPSAADPEPRYGLLEALRVFALARLVESGDEPEARRAHLAHHAVLAREAASHYAGPEASAWLNRMIAAEDNVRTALAWALAPAAEPARGELAVGLVAWMGPTWTAAGRVREGAAWLERARPHAERFDARIASGALAASREHHELLARYWHAAGTMHRHGGADRRSAEMYQRAMEAFEAAGYVRGMAMARHDLASRLIELGEHDEALRLAEANVTLYESLGIENPLSATLGLMGLLRLRLDDLNGARAALLRSLDIARDNGNATLAAFDLLNLAEVEMAAGDLAATAVHLDALFAEAIRFPSMRSSAFSALGRLREAQGRPEEALRCAQDALRAAEEGTEEAVGAEAVAQAGFALVRLGDVDGGVRLLGAASALRERMGRPPRTDAYYARGLEAARAAAAGAFDGAWAAGRALSRDAAISRVLAEHGKAASEEPTPARAPATLSNRSGPTSPVPLGELTRREREVARLMARGHTNEEIAAELVIAVKTVEMHAGRVLQKLGFRNRAQLAAWAAAEGRLG